VLLPASPTAAGEVALTAVGTVVGLVAMLLCTAAAVHHLRRDRPLTGLWLLFAGPALLLAAQVAGTVQVAVALAVALPLGVVVRLVASRRHLPLRHPEYRRRLR
jgi:hypothetical protein